MTDPTWCVVLGLTEVPAPKPVPRRPRRSPRSSQGDGVGRQGDPEASTLADVLKQVGVVDVGLKKRW